MFTFNQVFFLIGVSLMNRLMTGIALTASLVLTQSCSLSPKAEEKPATAATKQHEEQAMSGMSHEGHSANNTSDEVSKASIQAKLTAPSNIAPNTPVPLAINIRAADGKALKSFDTFHEELMHLIVVSDDLQFFRHLHPTYKQNGRFEVEARFPQPGGYTFFSDYKPAGQTEQVSLLKAQVSGNSSTTQKIDFNRNKTFADTKVKLAVSQATVKAGEEVSVMFNLRDAVNNQPVTDLKPYMGERGHLVILRQSSPLTKDDYVHAHAVKDTPPGQVHFMTSFPHPGKYKLWGQFNRNGRIVTANFWVDVV